MLVFYWNDDYGNEKWTVIDGRFFVGRPTWDMSEHIEGFNPMRIYMYWDRNRIIDTGYSSLFVSRKHLLVEAENSAVRIMDHGSQGRGSSNGTYLNNTRIPSGEWVEVKAGDIIGLGGKEKGPYNMVSPAFLIIVGLLGSDNKPVITVNTRSTYLPETIVEAASDKGIRIFDRVYEKGSAKPIVRVRIPDKNIYVETNEARIYFNNKLFTLLYYSQELYKFLLQAYRENRLNTIIIHNIKAIIQNNLFIDIVRQECSKNTYNKLQEAINAVKIEAYDIAIDTLHEFLTQLHSEIGIQSLLINNVGFKNE